MNENDFVKQNIAPEDGISKSSFWEIINGLGTDYKHRGIFSDEKNI
jgi:hypothetical protein